MKIDTFIHIASKDGHKNDRHLFKEAEAHPINCRGKADFKDLVVYLKRPTIRNGTSNIRRVFSTITSHAKLAKAGPVHMLGHDCSGDEQGIFTADTVHNSRRKKHDGGIM